MKLKQSLLMGTAAVFLMSAPALAEGNYYVSGSIGYNFASDFDGDQSGAGPIGADIDIDFDEDISFAGTVGYAYDLSGPFDPRVEFEIAYREDDIDQIEINGNDVAGNGAFGGDFEVLTYMVNAIVDYDTGSAFKPYVGVGVGFADIEAGANYLNGGGVAFELRESDTVFAAQGIVGASYEVSDRIEFFGDARYLATSDAEFERANALGATTDHDGNYTAFTLSTGIRYKF